MPARKLIACRHAHTFTATPGDPLGGIEFLMATGESEREAETNVLELVRMYGWARVDGEWECIHHRGYGAKE